MIHFSQQSIKSGNNNALHVHDNSRNRQLKHTKSTNVAQDLDCQRWTMAG